MRITIAQLNPTVGDIRGNTARVLSLLDMARQADADLIVFPELFLTGYPPRDLLERPSFLDRVEGALAGICEASAARPETGLLLGAPIRHQDGAGKGLYNAVVLIQGGRVRAVRGKSLLPAYDVFDEVRYFDSAPVVAPVPFKNESLGLTVCEDAWNDAGFWPRGRLYSFDPVAELAAQGATIFINISASPFHAGKEEQRYALLSRHARRHGRPFVYVNQIGANDELIFDGRSLALDGRGEVSFAGAPFREEVATIDTAAAGREGLYQPQERIASVHHALVLGIRDYMRKTGFSRALIGLSGGIDSALTCALAVAALGPDNVLGISMPSPFSSTGSIDDSRRLADNLGVRFEVISITPVYQAYIEALREQFAGCGPDVAEENIQARIRGNILMAVSNKFGHLVLSTGNKSEMAVGYCTLYGDMSGGLAVLADVPKVMVYQLAAYINREREIIPQAVIDKPPSAELRLDQKDQDTLPPYPILDEILQLYIEENLSPAEIASRGFDPATVNWVAAAVRKSEYKRRQAAPGLKVTSKAFGFGRRMPIAARWGEELGNRG